MMFPKVATITLALLPGALSACLNDQTYKYQGATKARSCSNIRIKEERRQKLCLLDEVRDACPQTCGLCCEDDPDFLIPLEKVKGAEQPCSWITLNDKKVDIRRDKYCGLDYFIGTTTIRNMCPLACDFCQEEVIVGTEAPTISMAPAGEPTRPPSPMPSPFPTLRPTSSPSETPSDVPSVSPSDAPSTLPSSSPSDMPSSSPSAMPSSSPSASPSDMPSSSPSSSPSDMPSAQPSATPSSSPSASPSDMPSSSPSDVPSDLPSLSPSEQPSNSPTMSIKPSPLPSVAPNGPPTASPVGCSDDSSFTFELTKQKGVFQDCAWLTKNEDKTAIRTATYCEIGEIKFAGCPGTCGGCTCADDSSFTFELTKQKGVFQDCAWITKNNVATRRGAYCDSVGAECPAACGFC